jgi:hypothetical protein
LADQPPNPGEPQVERAWARIDGSVAFLVSFDGKKARVTKSLQYDRLAGSPEYDAINIFGICDPPHDYGKMCDLAALAAVRFERAQEPEKHNLYNDWDHHVATVRQPAEV